jgi:two-component system, NtrC family, nitrogen regulation sensor histidine kinase NtrY
LNRAFKYLIWLVISLAILSSFIGWEATILQNTVQQEKNNYERIQQVFFDKEAESKDLIYQLLKDTSVASRKWTDFLDQAKNESFIVHLFRNDSLILWTDNTVNSIKYLPALKDGFFYLNTNNGAYLVSFLQKGSYKIAIFFQLKTNYLFQNQYIQNHINPDLSFLGSALFSPSPIKDFHDIFDRKGKYVCSIQIFGFPKLTPLWLRLLILVNLVVSAWLFHLVISDLIGKYFYLTSITFLSLTQIARWLFLTSKTPLFIYSQKLFSPDIYASSLYNPSLGDFLVATLTLLWYLLIIKDVKPHYPKNKAIQFLQLGFVSWLTIVLSDAAFDSIKSLVFDSQISFDIKNIYDINVYTFLGLLLAFLLLLVCYQMVLRFYQLLQRKDLSFYEKFFMVGLVFYFLHPYLVLFLFERKADYSFASSFLILSFIAYKHWVQDKMNRFQKYFVLVVLLSIFASLTIYYYSLKEEEESRFLYASKRVSQNDVNAEYFLLNVEKKIAEGNIIRSYYKNPIGLKSQLVKRLRQLYFSGYLGKYDISIYDFDSSFNHKQVRNIFSYQQVNYIYKNLGSATINQNFKFLKNNAYLKGYLGKFVIKENGEILGVFFIHLQPKLLQDENRFDELLIEGFRTNYNKHYNYSYAIYRDRRLLSQSGDFAYRTTFTWNNINDKSAIFEEDGYSHLLFKESDQLFVVVSKEAPSWFEPFGLFSLSFTFFTLILLAFIFLYFIFNNRWTKQLKWQENKIWIWVLKHVNQFLIIKDTDLSLIRTRIQLGIVLIVFVTLGSTAYFTIDFISQQNLEKQNEKLVKKIRNVLSAIENESQEVNFASNQIDAEASINQIADFYNTDITFFNPEGELIASTIKKVYDDGILAPLMNATAFYHLNNLRESQYVQQEQIATFQYTGAYVPVFGKNRNLLGYVQLPNFYQSTDLYTEISSIIVGFINLYALMFLVIGIMAWIVSRNISFPLMLLQKQMANTSFEKKNEPILWNRKDEIGELVKEYNLMLNQLEESASKLAKSEREGAWRDIARQIAHEIKNPLTPMKLSVQHLERAWNDQSPKLPETFARVTKTLITQIDTLSDLATEFSSFAKMPAPRYENIDVYNLLDQIVHLQLQTFDGKIEVNCQQELLLWYDASYLNRTLTNLVKNATQAIPEDKEGLINIRVNVDEEWMQIEVQDNGTGISEEQKEKVFMPYFSTKVIGMGLGLPIVKSMIESGGGSIWFETKWGTGTIFKIRLPLKKAE